MKPPAVNRFGRQSTRGHVRKAKRTMPTGLVVVFGLIGIAALYGLIQLIWPNGEDSTLPNTSNRTWLDNDWTTTQPTRETIGVLAARLDEHDVDIVYVEAGSWLGNGTYRPQTYMTEFRDLMAELAPDVQVLAWVWVNNALYSNEDSQISLEGFTRQALQEGYDGIHLQGYEVFDGNAAYVNLVRRIDTLTSDEDAILSVTVPPDRRPADPDVPIGGGNLSYSWTPRYKQQIGLIVDEMVIMGHDAGLSSAEDYETWLAYQVETYAHDIARVNDEVVIIVALPTYPQVELHDPAIENVTTALRGTRNGIDQAGSDGDMIKGVGIYTYAYATPSDWAVVKKEWLKQ